MQANETSTAVNLNELRMGVAFWRERDGVSQALSMMLKHLDCEVVTFLYDAPLPANLDMVFVRGPYGSLVPLANQILALDPAKRPSLVFMMSEQLPSPELPEWLRYWGSLLRSWIERVAYYQEKPGHWRIRSWLRWVTAKAFRFRYYGDLFWLQRKGILSALVISSLWTANFLRERGFNPTVFPLSYQPDKELDWESERDIPVLWLGKIGSSRRKRILNRIRTELKERGIEMMFVDGVESPYVFGEERTRLLNRTKIVLNLLREEWDDNSMRYVLSMPQGALVVTEPTLPHTAFIPDKHLVSVPIDEITDTICYYLEHEDERRKIAEQAFKEITRHSRVESLIQLIEQVVQEREDINSQSDV